MVLRGAPWRHISDAAEMMILALRYVRSNSPIRPLCGGGDKPD